VAYQCTDSIHLHVENSLVWLFLFDPPTVFFILLISNDKPQSLAKIFEPGFFKVRGQF